MLFLLAAVLLLVGLAFVWLIYERTPDEREYSLWWWVAASVAASGCFLGFAILTDLRRDYVITSTIVAVATILLSLLVGKVDDQYLPPLWLGVGVVLSNTLLVILTALSANSVVIALVGASLGAALFGIGVMARRHDHAAFDALLSVGMMALMTAGLLQLDLIRTPLEHLNDVLIPDLNRTIARVSDRVVTYDIARAAATAFQGEIADLSDESPAYVEVATQHLSSADSERDRAVALLNQAGERRPPVDSWSEDVRQTILDARVAAQDAEEHIQRSADELDAIEVLYTGLAEEYTRTFLWFEIGNYWPNEASDSNYKACYYGEIVSTIAPDGSVEEVLIDDSVNGRTGDRKGTNWKIFTVRDYEYLVNAGIVAPMDSRDPSETAIGNYLCGTNPQNGLFGVLGEPPIVLVKEQGTLQLAQEDEDAFVGNYRYGAWCIPDPSGSYQEIAEDAPVPPEAEWCWHQPDGSSTDHYYVRSPGAGGFAYIRGPRRCVDCTPQVWRGDSLVPARTISNVNGTDVPGVRGPQDLNGGPGSGK